jgi:hypothetical protein
VHCLDLQVLRTTRRASRREIREGIEVFGEEEEEVVVVDGKIEVWSVV